MCGGEAYIIVHLLAHTLAAAPTTPPHPHRTPNPHLPTPLRPPAAQVNASDTRGKADSSVVKGVGGKLANAVKELSTNLAISYDARGQRKKVRYIALVGL